MAKVPGARKTRRGEDRIELRAVARVLQQVREEAGISQKSLSLQLGKPSNFIWRIESGRTLPDIITILDVAQIVGIQAGDILNRAVSKAETESEEPNGYLI